MVPIYKSQDYCPACNHRTIEKVAWLPFQKYHGTPGGFQKNTKFPHAIGFTLNFFSENG